MVVSNPTSPTAMITEEHEMLLSAVRDFAKNEIAPIAAEFDETGDFPVGTVKKMGEMGLMGIEVPEEYGGAGMDTMAYVLSMIEIAKADASHSTILSVNNSLYNYGILKFGTEEQIREWVTPIATGEQVGAYSLTEPASGSDAATMSSRAVLNEAGTHYIINGTKSWVTSGPVADRIVLFTMTDPDKGNKGITAFLIDTSKPGFIRGKKEPKLGIRASATSEIMFDNYECPVENVLGEVGKGFKIA
jgi:alkylation response protein AidB-like acyl-CoA dehydrogenase